MPEKGLPRTLSSVSFEAIEMVHGAGLPTGARLIMICGHVALLDSTLAAMKQVPPSVVHLYFRCQQG